LDAASLIDVRDESGGPRCRTSGVLGFVTVFSRGVALVGVGGVLFGPPHEPLWLAVGVDEVDLAGLGGQRGTGLAQPLPPLFVVEAFGHVQIRHRHGSHRSESADAHRQRGGAGCPVNARSLWGGVFPFLWTAI